MKAHLVLVLLLLPLCSAQYNIECYGHDFLMVQNQILQCSGPKPQFCYKRDTGEKGCTLQKHCTKPGWTCCDTNRCNA